MATHLERAAQLLERAAQAPTRTRILSSLAEALEALGDAPEVPGLLKEFVLKPQVRRLRANPTFPTLAPSFWTELREPALERWFYRAQRHYDALGTTEAQFPTERPARPSERAEDCPICCMPLQGTKVKTLACRHVFHANCIDQWASYSYDTCPMCRRIVNISLTGEPRANTRP